METFNVSAGVRATSEINAFSLAELAEPLLGHASPPACALSLLRHCCALLRERFIRLYVEPEKHAQGNSGEGPWACSASKQMQPDLTLIRARLCGLQTQECAQLSFALLSAF